MIPADAPPATDPASAEVLRAVAFVLRSTQARPQTEAEVRGRLRSREVPTDVADAAIRRARQIGAIDDVAFAAAWVADRGEHRGYGIPRLREELRRRLVPDDIIESALRVLDGRDEEEVAEELARERFARMPASVEPAKAAQRLTAYLTRRGYRPGLAERVAIRVSGADRRWD